MKVAFVVLLVAASAVAKEVKLRDGITPQKLPAVHLSQNALLSANEWETIRDTVLMNSESVEAGFIQADVTEYAYKILENIQTLIIGNGYDPMELSNDVIKLFPTGTVTLSNGWLEELSTMNVSDAVIVKYSMGTQILDLTLPLTFKSLLITYDYHTQIILLGITGSVDAKISNVKLNLHMGFNFTNYHAFVDNADVKDSGTIEFIFTGLGLLDWVIDLLIGVLTTLFHTLILSVINVVIDIPVHSVVNTINGLMDSFLQPNGTNTTYTTY